MTSAPGPGGRGPHRTLDAFVRRVGARSPVLTDLYAFLLRARWSTVVGLAAVVYLGLNALFALLYWVVPGSVGSSDGSYLDAFFFSVQTFASIGYGVLHPVGRWANAIVVVEAFASVFCIATLTGIVFAKFSRPHARVLFSDSILIETRDGVPTLTFRVANERGNDVVEASVRISILKTQVSAEGVRMRRFLDLKLERDTTPVFFLTWQIFHRITEDSPIHGLHRDDLLAGDVRFIVSLTGIDGTFAQTIHARHVYWADEVLEGYRFVDVIDNLPGGISQMDFRRFHQVVPEKLDAGRRARSAS